MYVRIGGKTYFMCRFRCKKNFIKIFIIGWVISLDDLDLFHKNVCFFCVCEIESKNCLSGVSKNCFTMFCDKRYGTHLKICVLRWQTKKNLKKYWELVELCCQKLETYKKCVCPKTRVLEWLFENQIGI